MADTKNFSISHSRSQNAKNFSISHSRSQNAARKVINPFVCGTFRDFHEERDFLNEEIFPQLDAICKERGLSFQPVDLRWNSKQGQGTSEQILRVCLDNVEHCAPYFICLLGDRYGVHRPAESEVKDEATEQWLDKNFDTAALCGYEWVHEEEYRYSSLTELEVVKASFRKKYDYGYFYFRSPEHLEQKLAEADPQEKEKLHSDHQCESEYAARKLKELKQQIIDTELPVKTFNSLKELGELVLHDWTIVINTLYPPIHPSVFQNTNSELFHQWSLHEAFAESHRQIFVRSPVIREMMDVLNVHAEVEQGIKRKTSMALTHVLLSTFMTSVPGEEKDSLPPILVLVGERGCGKSALVCNWLKQFGSSNPEVVVIPHHVGIDAASSDVTNLMSRCTHELRLQYLNSVLEDLTGEKNNTDFRRVTEAFIAAIDLGPSVIVVDGMNAFGKSHDKPAFEVKELQWLPSKLPKCCRVIVTTVKSDVTYRALKKRTDTTFIEVANLLDLKAQRKLLSEYVGANYTKFIDDQHFAKISSSKLSNLPLYYVSIANELRILGAHKNSERLLDLYVHALTVCDLWRFIIRRWTHDYGWLRPVASRSPVPSIKAQASRDRMNSGWVADAMRLFSVSRNGMKESEMLEALKGMGYANNFVITTAYWSMLRIVAQNALLQLPSGLLTFSHEVIRNAVDLALLGNLTSPSQERMVSTFSDNWERQKQQCHVVLSNFFKKEPTSLRKVDELPWQLMVCGNLDDLAKVFADPAMFLLLVHDQNETRLKTDLLCYWRALEKAGLKPQEILQEMATQAQERLTDSYDEPERKRIDSARAFSSIDNDSVIDRISSKTEEDPLYPIEVSTILYHVGRFLKQYENYSAAENYLLTAYKIGYPVASVQDLELMGQIQRSLGDLYAIMFDMSNAEIWYTNALKTVHEMTNVTDKKKQEATIGRLLNQLALVQMGSTVPVGPVEDRPKSRQPSRGSQSKSSSGRISERETRVHLTVGPLLSQALKHLELAQDFNGISNVYFNMGLLAMKQHQWADARTSLQTALDMRKQWFGSTHPMVAEVIDMMGTLCWNETSLQQDLTEPEKLYREALRMREATLGPSHLLVASTLFKLGKLLHTKNTKDTTKEARQLFQRALDIRTTKLGVYSNATKTIRRALMNLETTDVAFQFGTSLAIKEQPLVLLRDYKQQLIARSSSRLAISGK